MTKTENTKLRKLRLSDFFELHRMYDSLDEAKSRPFFDLYWLGLEKRSIKWYFAQIPLFLSTFRLARFLLYKIYPFAIFLSVVAADKDKVVSYGFLIVRNKYKSDLFSVELGIAVRDHYQGEGLGKKMMNELISYAKTEPIGEITLTTRTDNKVAYGLYKGLGFVDQKILKGESEWQGKKYDMHKMSYALKKSHEKQSTLELDVIANNSLVTADLGMSGGDRIFIELVKRLPKRKSVNTHVFGALNLKKLLDKRKIKGINFTLISKHDLNVFDNLFVGSIRRLLLGLRAAFYYEVKESKRIVFSTSDYWPDVFPALLLKIRYPKTRWLAGFYQFVSPPWVKHSPYKSRFFWGLLYYLMQIPVYLLIKQYSDMVFVTSAPDVQKFPKQAKNNSVFVVRGGVDTTPSEKYLGAKNHLRLSNKRYQACFLGRLHYQKGVLLLVDIWKKVTGKKPNAKLAIIGNGPLEVELNEKIAQTGLANSIDMLGFLDGKPKHEIFKKSNIVVHPATYDSGGMAAAEAMAWGLPGVSFDLKALKTYYPRGVIKTKKGDLTGFSNNILKLLNDKALYQATSEQAVSLIREKWSWDQREKEVFKWLIKRL